MTQVSELAFSGSMQMNDSEHIKQIEQVVGQYLKLGSLSTTQKEHAIIKHCKLTQEDEAMLSIPTTNIFA